MQKNVEHNDNLNMESFLFNLCKYLYLRGRSYKALSHLK
jgi:hypothetical protein